MSIIWIVTVFLSRMMDFQSFDKKVNVRNFLGIFAFENVPEIELFIAVGNLLKQLSTHPPRNSKNASKTAAYTNAFLELFRAY